MRTSTDVVQLLKLLGVVSAVALTPGCASIVKGTTQSVTVNTDPAGATCVLSRDGQQVAVINPTPGTVTVDKARGTISVTCKKVGYQDAAGAMAASFQAMTFGNIISGGRIDGDPDQATGAMNEYPPMVTVTMVPEEFPSVVERDVFFDNMKTTFLTEADEVRQRIRQSCKDNCDPQLKAVDDGVGPKLAEIEARRFSAKVRGR